MAYEKPVVVTLTFASPAIRGGGSDHDTTSKATFVKESGIIINDSGNGGDGNQGRTDSTETSSSSGAYEADE